MLRPCGCGVVVGSNMSASRCELTPAELKAVEEHKYFLSQQRGHEVTIEEATADFLARFAQAWRQEKLLNDNRDQRSEIEKHRYFRSMEEGRDIGRASAAAEWCEKYAHIWRAERESLERNGFACATVHMQNACPRPMRFWSSLTELIVRYDCSLYVHKEGMTYWNFIMAGQPYMNAKSAVGLLSLDIAAGDQMEFIATGAHATQALEAVAKLMTGAADAPTE
jgi:phosphotransferase system HPr-like phosphotransfer protein